MNGKITREKLQAIIQERTTDPIMYTEKDLARLDPGIWLNDEIINNFGKILMEWQKSKDDWWFESTFLISELLKANEKKKTPLLPSWNKKLLYTPFFGIFIPWHSGGHWSFFLSVHKTLFYLDSVHKEESNEEVQRIGGLLKSYYCSRGRDIEGNVTVVGFPQQENGWDCGVYVLKAMGLLILEHPRKDMWDMLAKSKRFWDITEEDCKQYRVEVLALLKEGLQWVPGGKNKDTQDSLMSEKRKGKRPMAELEGETPTVIHKLNYRKSLKSVKRKHQVHLTKLNPFLKVRKLK